MPGIISSNYGACMTLGLVFLMHAI